MLTVLLCTNAQAALVCRDRSELPDNPYARVSSKAMLDHLDQNQLIPYMKRRSITLVAFARAHGIPEVLVVSPLVRRRNCDFECKILWLTEVSDVSHRQAENRCEVFQHICSPLATRGSCLASAARTTLSSTVRPRKPNRCG
jgi:hypothetical protein